MHQTNHDHLEFDGGTIYYETAGMGDPLVLVHAGFLDSRMFDAQWEALARHFHVIRYDMLGYGRSSVVQAPVCRRAELRHLLQHLDVQQARFVGCSLGGATVLDLALESPEMARSLTLIGAPPSGFELQGAPPRYMLEMFAALQHNDIEQANELQIRIWLDGETRAPDAVESQLRQAALSMNRIPVERQTFLLADMQPACPLDPPAVKRLNEVTCPALIITGALDNRELHRAADLMAAEIPQAQHVQIEDAAHVPSFEKPDQFTRILLDFLRAQ